MKLEDRFYCCATFHLLPPTGTLHEVLFSRWRESEGKGPRRRCRWKAAARCGSPQGWSWAQPHLDRGIGKFPELCFIPSQPVGLREHWLLCERSCNWRLWSCILIGLLKWLFIPSLQLQQSPFEISCSHWRRLAAMVTQLSDAGKTHHREVRRKIPQ